MPKVVDKLGFVNALYSAYGKTEFTRQELEHFCNEISDQWDYPVWLVTRPENRPARGVYSIAAYLPKNTAKTKTVEPKEKIQNMIPAVTNTDNLTAVAMSTGTIVEDKAVSLVPAKASGYVPFGHFNDVRAIIKSTRFYPVYVTGLSGNGKTMMIEQVCAQEKREVIRVNITIETDEDDLIGGFRLVEGRTVWQNGPVVHAMERGAILLLDEVDLGSNKLMCLQPILEGHGIYLKKINKKIDPALGFNIIATANTKGKGSDDGRFIGTNVMNEAFLERFSITLEQEYPSQKVEQKILNNVLQAAGVPDKDFATKLVAWADVIRKSFAEGAVTEIISTRRLVHICEAFGIFEKNREKAITLCLNRFDTETKTSFFDLYKKVDESMSPKATEEAVKTTDPF